MPSSSRASAAEAFAVCANAARPTLTKISRLLDTKPPVDAERILLYLHGHLFEPRLVLAVRRRLRLEPSAFEEFREHFGVTVESFVETMRLEIAQRVLRTSSIRVSVIARQLGFKSPRRFGALFQRRFGSSPSAYRRS